MTDRKTRRIVRVNADQVDAETGEILEKPGTQEPKNSRNQEIKNSGSPQVGVTCPNCGCGHLDTYDSRPLPGGMIRRYKRCRHCGRSGIRTLEKKA